MPSLSKLTASLLADVTAASALTKRQVGVLMRKHKLPGSLRGRGTDWELEVKNEKEKRQVEKVLGQLGGFMTGYGGWVLSQGYRGKGDYMDKSSPHHYASKKVKVKGKDLKPGDKLPGPGGKGVFEVTKVGPGPGKMLRVRGKSVNDIMMINPDKDVEVTRKAATKLAAATEDLRQVTAAVLNPAALAAAKKWSARLTDAQRKLAGKLAKALKRTGFSTGMFKDFQSLGLKSLNMESFLRMGQMPKAQYQRIVDQTVEMLEMGAEAAHDKYAGDWPHLAEARPEGVNASATWPVKVSFRGTKQPWFKDRMYNLYKGNLTVMLGTSSERSEVEIVASSGGLRHVKAPKMPYSIAEAAVFALLKNRAL